jgi:hypothetical protein
MSGLTINIKFILICLVLSASFSSCNLNKRLTFKNADGLPETCRLFFGIKGKTILRDQIYDSQGGGIDAGIMYDLNLVFPDTFRAEEGRQLDAQKDTASIKCTWSRSTAWDFRTYAKDLRGFIIIRQWKRRCIKLEIQMDVTDPHTQKKFSYSGTRTFRKRRITAGDYDEKGRYIWRDSG